MARTITNSDDIDAEFDNITDAKTLVDDLDTYHDPANDKYVNHVNLSFTQDADDNWIYHVTGTVRKKGVADSDIPTELDNLGTAISGFTGVDVTASEASDSAGVSGL